MPKNTKTLGYMQRFELEEISKSINIFHSGYNM